MLNKKNLIVATTLTCGYLLVIGYFNFVEVYDRHFFDRKYVLLYNCFRVLFTAYLFWIIYFSGLITIRALTRSRAVAQLDFVEGVAACFFTGAAAWTLFMLVLGYACLYYRIIAVILTAPIVACSATHALEIFREARRKYARRSGGTPPIERGAIILVQCLVAASAVLLLVVKGLYPLGGHDYYTHYFYFYTTAIDNHHIWPNEVWYHYFYSKGMGLFFLGMLLTDPLAPSLITYCFSVATACGLFSLIRRACSGTLWPGVAVVLYLALYTYTLNTGNWQKGGWGEFGKPHEVNAAFVFAIFWTSTCIVRSKGEQRSIWLWACSLCSFVIAFLLAISSGLIGAFILAMAGYLFIAGQRADAKTFFHLGLVTGSGLATVLILNYVTTGIPLDVGINFFWPIVDLARVSKLGWVLETRMALSAREYFWAHPVPLFSEEMQGFAENVVKYGVLWPLFLCTLIGLAGWVIARITAGYFAISKTSTANGLASGATHPLTLALIFTITIAVFTLVAGRTEAVSYVRYSSFMLPVLIAVMALVWQQICASLPERTVIRPILRLAIPVFVLLVSLGQPYATYNGNWNWVVLNGAWFVSGRFSVYEAYTDQAGWQARMPFGAIHPGMLAAWREVGPGARIWTFYIHSYCMLPNCRAESFASFRISPHEPEIFLGTPDRVREILRSENLNHFFISWDMEVRDPLTCTALFSADHIKDYLGVRWADGTSFLLTWLGPGVTPLTPDWIAKYRAHLDRSVWWARCDQEPLYIRQGREIYEQVVQGKRWGFEISITRR